MSAPWEVWITICPDDEGKPFPVDANFKKRLKDDVLYLRADLTCGLCGKRYSLHPGVWNCRKFFGSGFEYKRTACMAFVPKEK